MKKTFALLLALIMALMLFPAGAMAVGTTKNITSSDQLAAAILAQADGETWNLAANTTFDLTESQVDLYKDLGINGSKSFIFPIIADNLTINGGPGTVITTSKVTNTGNWNYQNFITIAGDNVTLNGLTLIPGRNQYDDDANGINKIIEVLGVNSTIKNIRTQPRDGGDFSGTIYYSNDGNNSTDVLENVYLCRGRISLTGKTNGTLEMSNVTIDFVNAMRGPGYESWEGFRPNQTPAGSDVEYEIDNVRLIMSQFRLTEYEKLENRPDPDLTAIVADGSTEVKATVDPTFTVVIPAAVDFGKLDKSLPDQSKAFPVAIQNALLEDGAGVQIRVNSGFTMASGANTLGYALYNVASGGTALSTGSIFCTFGSDTAPIGNDLSAAVDGRATCKPSELKGAGTYVDAMTFTITYLANPS